MRNTNASCETNKYISKPKHGIELISRLLAKSDSDMENRNENEVIFNRQVQQMLSTLDTVSVQSEQSSYYVFKDICNKLRMLERVKLLANRTVIGVGGQFSSGKSCFLNSLIGSRLLPEDQTPTTSIPTYIIGTDTDSIMAYTTSSATVPLSNEETQALTHAFNATYNLGFSNIVSNLLVTSKVMKHKNIALLDTPGYSKADPGRVSEMTDFYRAIDQLSGTDKLIWLLAVTDGTIHQSDIDFLSQLVYTGPILVVVNKCDKIPPENVEKVIEQVKKDIGAQSYLNVCDVVAYSSINPDAFIEGRDALNAFLEDANTAPAHSGDICAAFDAQCKQLETELGELLDKYNEIKQSAFSVLCNSTDAKNLKTWMTLFSDTMLLIQITEIARRDFLELSRTAKATLKKILGMEPEL